MVDLMVAAVNGECRLEPAGVTTLSLKPFKQIPGSQIFKVSHVVGYTRVLPGRLIWPASFSRHRFGVTAAIMLINTARHGRIIGAVYTSFLSKMLSNCSRNLDAATEVVWCASN